MKTGKTRNGKSRPITFPWQHNPKVRPKLLSAMDKATVALRPKSRRFWGKPKPFKVSDLQVGDLAFSRFESKFSDSISSLVTGFPPTHVSLYVGEGQFFDLSERAKIVRSETLFTYFPNPFIFRPALSEAQKSKLVSFARELVKNKIRRGKRIRNIIGFQRTIGIKVKNPADEGYLCSTAITEIFEKAGVNLVPGVHPLRVSPTDLLKSKKLEAINA